MADPTTDDQSLAVETESGTVLVCSCCHAGLHTTIEHAENVTGRAVHAIVSGPHLKGSDGKEIHEIADWLGDRLDFFAPAHCTGMEAEQIFASRILKTFEVARVGSTFDFAGLNPNLR